MKLGMKMSAIMDIISTLLIKYINILLILKLVKKRFYYLYFLEKIKMTLKESIATEPNTL